jgi:acyl carrier protein
MTPIAPFTENQIRDAICAGLKRIAPEAEPELLAPTEDVREALDIDSFDFLYFLVGLNELFGVEIPEKDYGQLVSLDDITGYIAARLR